MRLSGHFAVFNEWATIDSTREGRFRETVAPGTFTKTIRENRDRVRVLLNHGRDPELGDRPLGPLTELREDKRGGYYEARLLDGVPELVLAGLREQLYGASFSFSVLREEFQARPGRSESNPQGIPERVLREVKLHEISAVTWPAYHGATASARSADVLELRAVAERWEIIPDGIGRGEQPLTIRRLRREGSTRARELLHALEAGARVEIAWGGAGRSLGRVVERRAVKRSKRNESNYHLPRTPTREWRLP